jgi:hypothetical protein
MNYTDDVNGQVIGAVMSVGWLTYEGRKQGQTLYAESEDALQRKAAEVKASMLRDGAAHLIWPDNAAWKLVIAQ